MKRIISYLLTIILISLVGVCFAQDGGSEEIEGVEPYPITTYFSFASDSFHQGPTFKGAKNYIEGYAEVNLLTDLNNDKFGGLVTFLSTMEFKAELYDYQAFYIGSQWLHVWKVYAEVNFSHLNPPVNGQILTIAFKEGVLTSWSQNEYTIGETMTLQDSESADKSIFMRAHPVLIGIGVKPEYLEQSEDIAFTFTNVRRVDIDAIDDLVKVDREGNLLSDWCAEGSFSASACYR